MYFKLLANVPPEIVKKEGSMYTADHQVMIKMFELHFLATVVLPLFVHSEFF